MRACAALAASSAAFRVTLKVDLLDGFLALVPDGDPAALQDLADALRARSRWLPQAALGG